MTDLQYNLESTDAKWKNHNVNNGEKCIEKRLEDNGSFVSSK